jgi:hypothetical protein
MRAKVFFAENNIGVKLSFTRLSLKKALENINKKSLDNEFTIIDYIIVKKPKVVRDFISNSILDKQIENTDLYNISDIEIKEIIEYSREFFNAKISKNLDEDYDSDNKDFEEYDSENDPEYIPLNDEIIPEEEEIQATPEQEDADEDEEESEATPEEVIPKDESNEKEEPIIVKPLYVPKSKFFLVKEYFIIYSTAFILYNIFRYLKSNNYLSN